MKILHCADIHIGYENHGRLDPATGLNSRLLDFKRCFDYMVAYGLREDIDLFLFCGDAYRTADPTPTQQKIFAECLQPILSANIPVVMLIGNHDHPVSHGKAASVDIFSTLTDQVQVFAKPSVATIETKAGPLQFIALPWPIRSKILSKEEHRKKNPAEIRAFIEAFYIDFVQATAAALDPALPAILGAHLSVQGAELGGSERTSIITHEPVLSPSHLAHPALDYVALGHIHKFQDRNVEGKPPVVYCSSIERISFKEADEDKGFVMVEINTEHEEKTTTYEFIPTPARPFITVTADLRQSENPTEDLLKEINRYDVTDAVVRVQYEIKEGHAHEIDLLAIRQALKPAHVIATIDRQIQPAVRERRTVVTRESSLQDAMKQYLAQHEHLADLQPDLLTATAELEAEYNRTETSA